MYIMCVCAIFFRAPSLYSELSVQIIPSQYQMTVPRALGFIHMDRPRAVIVWYIVLWPGMGMQRRGWGGVGCSGSLTRL